MSNWTQPFCDEDYAKKFPGREPTRLKEPDVETCCTCGVTTQSGIYVRQDPNTVNYPKEK